MRAITSQFRDVDGPLYVTYWLNIQHVRGFAGSRQIVE